MCEGRIITATMSLNPDDYLPDPRRYSYWPNWIYNWFGAGLQQRLRRAIISVALSLGEYLIGLGVAAAFGFLDLYVCTPAVYVLCLAFGFYMGRARWLTLYVPVFLKCLRPSFPILDAQFRKDIEHVCDAALSRIFIIPFTLAMMLATWAAVGVYYFGPTPATRAAVASFVAPTFPTGWHLGSALVAKMLVIDMFLGLTCAFGVPLIFGSVVGLTGAYITLRSWRIVPLPAYVASALRPAADFLFSAATFYAVAVAVFAVIYAGQVSALYVGITAVLSLGGIGCLFGPYLAFRRIIDRAREQLGEDVATTFYQDVLPLTTEDQSPSDEATRARNRERYAEVAQLEQLLHTAGEDTGLVYRVDQVLRGALIQLAPTLLAILLVLMFAPGHLLGIFFK